MEYERSRSEIKYNVEAIKKNILNDKASSSFLAWHLKADENKNLAQFAYDNNKLPDNFDWERFGYLIKTEQQKHTKNLADKMNKVVNSFAKKSEPKQNQAQEQVQKFNTPGLEKLYNEHLVNFNDPLKLAQTTRQTYNKLSKTLKNNKASLPSEYAKLKNLTYRQYKKYQSACMQRHMFNAIKHDKQKSPEAEIYMQKYKRVRDDFYNPEPIKIPQIDEKHFERVLRGLKNSNKQRKTPLSEDELKNLAHERILKKQTKEMKQRNSKTRSLAQLPSIWQDNVREHLPEKWHDAALIVEATGCRPIEIVHKPVELTYNSKNETIVVKIYGAKTQDGPEYAKNHEKINKNFKRNRTKVSTGQEWREIEFKIGSDSYNKLAKVFENNMQDEKLFFQLHKKTNTFVQAYNRACKDAGFKKASIYSNRHLMGCKMKTEGWNYEQIAKALGHQATSSTSKYGYIKRGVGGSGVKSVSAASPVRTPGPASSGPSM